jgi:hypothetical protein
MRAVATILFCLTLTPALGFEPIVLRDMGSFHIGGRVVEIGGRPVHETRALSTNGVASLAAHNGTARQTGS